MSVWVCCSVVLSGTWSGLLRGCRRRAAGALASLGAADGRSYVICDVLCAPPSFCLVRLSPPPRDPAGSGPWMLCGAAVGLVAPSRPLPFPWVSPLDYEAGGASSETDHTSPHWGQKRAR